MEVQEEQSSLFEPHLKQALKDHFYEKKEFKDLKKNYNISRTTFFKYAGLMKEKMMNEMEFVVQDLEIAVFDAWLQQLIDTNKMKKATSVFQQWLTNDEELLLCAICFHLFRWGMPMSSLQLVGTAVAMASKKDTGKLGSVVDPAMSDFWLRSFKKRHPEVTLRKPEKLELKRAKAADPSNFYNFFALIESLFLEHRESGLLRTELPVPSQFYNMNEKGFDPRGRDSKKIGPKGEEHSIVICDGEMSPFHVTCCLTTLDTL